MLKGRSPYYSVCLHRYAQLLNCLLFFGCSLNYDALNNAVTCMFSGFFIVVFFFFDYCTMLFLVLNVPFFKFVVAFIFRWFLFLFLSFQHEKHSHTRKSLLFLFSKTLDLREFFFRRYCHYYFSLDCISLFL